MRAAPFPFAAISLAAISACGLPDGEYFGKLPTHDPTHLRWCNQGEPDHLDPGLASSTVSEPLVAELFDGLTRYDAHGLPEPSLARSWDVSPDLKTFTFHLRDDARWSDGHPVTAYDVAYSVLRVFHPLTASPNADNLSMIANETPYLARQIFVVRATGQLVTLDAAPAVDIAARTSSRDVALRDLGGEAYATLPAGATVSLVMTTGGKATWPSPDGTPWAYVFWPRDQRGVYGWVPLAALDGEPNGDARVGAYRARDLAYSTDAVGVAVPDAHTIVFSTTDPAPSFLAQTPSRAMRTVPIAQVSRWPRTWDRPPHVVTNGPFHLEAWRERDRVELVRSATYWDRAHVRLARITAFSIDDQAATTNLYYTGYCDATAANNIPSTYLPALNGEQRGGRAYLDYDVHPYLGVYFVWLNNQQLANRHLRRALALAVDRSQIPRFTHGGELPTAQYTPGTPIGKLTDAELAACGVARTQPGFALVADSGNCYVPPPGLDYDPVAAKQELAAARAEGGVPPEPLEYRYNAGSEAHKQIAEYLQAEWRAIGLDVRVTAEEWNSLLDDTRAHKFQLARFGNIGSSPFTESDFLPIFRCASPDNRGAYCGKDFERLMDEVPPIVDLRARNAKLREAEAVMIEDAPVIPLYVYSQKHLIKPYVHGYEINLYDKPPFAQMWLDP